MTAEEMKLKCMAIAGEIADLHDPEDYETPEESDMARAANRACLSVVNSIAAIPVEADPRDAQNAALREAVEHGLELAVMMLAFIGRDQGTSRFDKTIEQLCELARLRDKEFRAALSATEPKRNAPLSQTRDLDPGEGNNITNVERYLG